MYYDPKYDAMPLRGKVSINEAMARDYGQHRWSYDYSRRADRKYHRHYEPNKSWEHWAEGCIAAYHAEPYLGHSPSKGYRRKTWKDFY